LANHIGICCGTPNNHEPFIFLDWTVTITYYLTGGNMWNIFLFNFLFYKVWQTRKLWDIKNIFSRFDWYMCDLADMVYTQCDFVRDYALLCCHT
jgi:hypothetical protein